MRGTRAWFTPSPGRKPLMASIKLRSASRAVNWACRYWPRGGACCGHFGDDFGASINDADDVLHVVAEPVVALAATMEGFQLGGQEMDGGEAAYFPARGELPGLGPGQGIAIPAVGKAEDACVCRHQVEHHLATAPAANRGVRPLVRGKALGSQLFFDPVVVEAGCGFGDDVHIPGDAYCRQQGIGDEQTAGAATDENQELVEFAEPFRHGLQQCQIRVSWPHNSLSCNKDSASFCSRTLPMRTASTRASNS